MYAVVDTYLYYGLLSRLIQLRKSSIDIIITEFLYLKYYIICYTLKKTKMPIKLL